MTITANPPAMEIYMVVKDAGLIRRIMDSKQPKMSGRDLAKLMGWKSHTYLNRILAGNVQTVSNDTGVRLAYHLGVPADLIFATRASGNGGQIDRQTA